MYTDLMKTAFPVQQIILTQDHAHFGLC